MRTSCTKFSFSPPRSSLCCTWFSDTYGIRFGSFRSRGVRGSENWLVGMNAIVVVESGTVVL